MTGASTSTGSAAAVRMPSRVFFFSSPDLLSFLSRFLSIDDLLTCSGLSSALRHVLDSSAVWRPRLRQAQHIQSSFVPLEIQPPYVAPEDDDDEKPPTPPTRRGSRRSSSLSCPPPPPCPAAFDASLGEVAEQCYAHYRNALHAMRIRCEIFPVAILPATSSSPTSSSSFSSSPVSLPASLPASSSVFHLKFLLTREALVNKFDCREFVLVREADWWRVTCMGPPDSGHLVLNAHNMERGDSGFILITPPSHPTAAARTPHKQQYIELMRCSEHCHTACGRLLPPTPALPPPRPTPAWFSQHLAALSFRQEPFPRIPQSLHPSFHPLPVCGQCRLGVLSAVLAFCGQYYHVPELGWQVDCLVRINGVQWDGRWKEFEDEIAYHRMSIRWREVEEEEEEQVEGGERGEGRMEGVARRTKGEWYVERVQMSDDSGVYAINTPSNLPWTNPIPPSPPTTHPPELTLHEHPLVHYPRSVYRLDEYGCDVCGESHRGMDVWHCSCCQLDCCAAVVQEARQMLANAGEERLELMKPLNDQDEGDS